MDLSGDPSTASSSDDITGRSAPGGSVGSLYHSSRWGSDTEVFRARIRQGCGLRILYQYCRPLRRKKRPASCPPAPQHGDYSPLCDTDSSAPTGGQEQSPVEQPLTDPLGTSAVRPEDQQDGSGRSLPGTAGVQATELALDSPAIRCRGDHILAVPGAAAGEDVGLTANVEAFRGLPLEAAGAKSREPPKLVAEPGRPAQELSSTSCGHNESSAHNPHAESQEMRTVSTPLRNKREGEEHGDIAGMKTTPPSASQTTYTSQGHRSPASMPIGSHTDSTTVSTAQRSPTAREAAITGRTHRWRWTPEHKLQPEFKPEGRRMKPRPSSGSEESDIPPFAERMRFFEETSRSRSVSHLPGLLCRAVKPRVSPESQRRHSYEESEPHGSTDGGELSNPEQLSTLGPQDTKLDLTADRLSCSSLCPNSTPGQKDHPQQQRGISRGSNPSAGTQLRGEKEQTQLKRNFSPPQSNYCCTGVLQTPEGAQAEDCQRRMGELEAGERLLEGSVAVGGDRELVVAVSEKEAIICGHRQQVLGGEAPRRKRDPPPRPPPPNWAQFHSRRASCTSLHSSSPAPPPSHSEAGPEVARQRSHSFPLRDGSEVRLHGHAPHFHPSVAQNPAHPGSSILAHSVCSPLAPPVERNPPPVWTDPLRLSDAQTEPGQRLRFCGRPGDGCDRGDGPKQREVAELGRHPSRDAQLSPGVPVYRASLSSGPAVEESESRLKSCSGEPYFTMTRGPQTQTASGSPPLGGRCMPLETDIDQFLEEQRVRCLTRPMGILETDIDSLPGTRDSAPASWRTRGGSLVDLLLEGGSGACRRAELTGEMLPYRGEGRPGWESWRGGGRCVLGLDPDTSQRPPSVWGSPSAQSPGPWPSSRYSTSSDHEQLQDQAKGLPGRLEEDDISYKTQLQMERVRQKLGVLREAQRALQEDIRANALLGEEVEALLRAVCRPGEVERFRSVSSDLEKVMSLLLSLSSRLLRVENALDDLCSETHHSQLPLLEKKRHLLAQLTEAQELKEHVDGRQRAVCRALGSSLSAEQLRDYSHFLRMKSALLVEQRQLEDRIRLHEEQLRSLRESLASSNSSPAGLEYSYY